MTVDVGSSFELLSSEEWEQYLSVTLFDKMSIDMEKFSSYQDRIFLYPRLQEAIEGHNNKVGDLKITYALCRHYFDKGIPDEPWYISPGKEGQSVQYVPNFEEEHWMRRYWFNHFAENLYLKFFSLWDDVVEILNIFFGIDESIQDYRFRANVMKKLKEIKPDIHSYMSDILKEETYKEANKYRTCFVHGYAPSSVTNGFLLEKDKTVSVPEVKDGQVVFVEKKVLASLTCRVGDYTTVKTVMENIDAFAVFSGECIEKLISKIITI